jgi:hypothetical protein
MNSGILITIRQRDIRTYMMSCGILDTREDRYQIEVFSVRIVSPAIGIITDVIITILLPKITKAKCLLPNYET